MIIRSCSVSVSCIASVTVPCEEVPADSSGWTVEVCSLNCAGDKGVVSTSLSAGDRSW